MRQIDFFPKQAKKIYGWKNSKTMKPVKIKDRAFLGTWDRCRGFTDTAEPDYYCVEFSHSEKAGTRRYYFTINQAKKVLLLFNPWMEDPILNKSALAHKIWENEEGNSLRRRLEQKGERGTLTKEEKKRIIKVLEEYLRQVKESLRI